MGQKRIPDPSEQPAIRDKRKALSPGHFSQIPNVPNQKCCSTSSVAEEWREGKSGSHTHYAMRQAASGMTRKQLAQKRGSWEDGQAWGGGRVWYRLWEIQVPCHQWVGRSASPSDTWGQTSRETQSHLCPGQ